MKLMYKTFTAGIVGIILVLLVLAATTNSVSAIQNMHSQNANPKGAANMMEQLHDEKNMTLGFRLGVTVTPMLCMSINGNTSGKPMIGSMMVRSMNQSGVMTDGQGNQYMAGLGTIMKHSSTIPVCFSISDATLLGSFMIHGGIMGANIAKAAGNATATTAAANSTKAAGNATATTAAANSTKAAGNATATTAAANSTKAAGNATATTAA